ncbi:MAG: peptidoglycan DD-metalloendopeptidase family protein [Pseudomonadota bacterium]
MNQAIERILPEWQVFVRRPNGTSAHFTFTRRRQAALLAGVAVVGLWAASASWMLTERPAHLAAKERALEELMAANRAAQHRLAAAEKMVGEVVREVDLVHANVVALAESNVALAKDAGKPAVKLSTKVRVGGDPAYDESGLTGGTESRAVREQVRRLESALERLRGTTDRVVERTAATASERIGETERKLSRLGLDPDKLVMTERRRTGQGGPFIPAPAGAEGNEGMGRLMERMAYWSGMKAAMERMPLAEPIRADHDFNSPFGTRNDPINNRTGVHEGIDLGAPTGTPVHATGSGIVDFAGGKDRYGLTVDIDHGNGVTTRYAHLSRIKVKPGQKVTRATVIGLVGNTGRSTGPHLHYEVRVSETPRDPVKFISVGRDAPKTR